MVDEQNKAGEQELSRGHHDAKMKQCFQTEKEDCTTVNKGLK